VNSWGLQNVYVDEEVVMSLRVDVQQSEDVTVLRLAGRIVRGSAVCVLKDAVISQKNMRIVILDLSEVENLDGGGLGMLVFLRRWTQENGIQLKLVNPSHLVREMLEFTGQKSLTSKKHTADFCLTAKLRPAMAPAYRSTACQ